MRLLLAMLLIAVSMTLVPLGAVFVLVGSAEQHHLDNAYVVGFVPGADCDGDHELYLRIEDGELVDCVPAGMFASGRINLPGFTDTQEDQVDDLVEALGEDGLSTTDQREIQHLVDQFAATVPREARPYHDEAVSGSDRTRLGIGMIVTGVVGVAGFFWLVKRRRATTSR
ncbi:hypothetical protein [Amycolatopsis sp. YIM 10]|uniref:hypothetical protein n=1 Tax=Amycolatopsis sp. YIM 10 TaxID=2653857 RepID=UPI00129024D2|nr:hypothetical protein [Amycolatopsis sp. YIM 10]QFU90974.1 hypothetical protein YIM_29010 [Amycolatopsis sp. YIM 10]